MSYLQTGGPVSDLTSTATSSTAPSSLQRLQSIATQTGQSAGGFIKGIFDKALETIGIANAPTSDAWRGQKKSASFPIVPVAVVGGAAILAFAYFRKKRGKR